MEAASTLDYPNSSPRYHPRVRSQLLLMVRHSLLAFIDAIWPFEVALFDPQTPIIVHVSE